MAFIQYIFCVVGFAGLLSSVSDSTATPISTATPNLTTPNLTTQPTTAIFDIENVTTAVADNTTGELNELTSPFMYESSTRTIDQSTTVEEYTGSTAPEGLYTGSTSDVTDSTITATPESTENVTTDNSTTTISVTQETTEWLTTTEEWNATTTNDTEFTTAKEARPATPDDGGMPAGAIVLITLMCITVVGFGGYFAFREIRKRKTRNEYSQMMDNISYNTGSSEHVTSETFLN